MTKTTILFGSSVLLVLLLSTVGGAWWWSDGAHMLIQSHVEGMGEDEKVEQFTLLRASIQEDMRNDKTYRCCLIKPCTYCIEKTPGHGEGAACDCLADIMNGKHPCGECIGEILEGHGSPYIAKYFARAIAEKTGEYDAIARIIEEKYGVPVEEQVK